MAEATENQPTALKDLAHVPIRFRCLFPVVRSKNPIVRACAVLWPWPRYAYPGVVRLRAWLLGMTNLDSVARYARIEVPTPRLAFVVSRLKEKRSDLDLIIHEIEVLIDERSKVSKVRVSKIPKVLPPSE